MAGNRFLQTHCRSDDLRILGCHVVGERAVEIVQVAAIAIAAGMRVDELARVPLRFRLTEGFLAASRPAQLANSAQKPLASATARERLASILNEKRTKSDEHAETRSHLQSDHVPRNIRRAGGGEHLLDMELSVGGPSATDQELDNRFSTMTEVRNVALAGLRDDGIERRAVPSRHSGNARAVPPLDPRLPEDRRRNNRPSGRCFSAHRPGRGQSADR